MATLARYRAARAVRLSQRRSLLRHRARSKSYRLTDDLVASYGGGPVVCLDARAIGQAYRLHASRPESFERVERADIGESVYSPHLAIVEEPEAIVNRVVVRGPIEQRAGYHDACGGWSDGHDAIAERTIAALEEGDVLAEWDSPGGAAAGLQEAVRRVVEAKARHGRRITSYVNETCGSAAYWWAAAISDEIYGPVAMLVGSIGARSAHASIAGALQKEGVDYTYFTWPGKGKIAFAPELPLSDIGRERGERDVTICGEAFAEAVSAARGIPVDAIIALNADCLSGKAAVKAGLVDGVATLEEVEEYALALASGEGATMGARAEEEDPKEKMRRAEEEEPDAEGEPDKMEGEEPEPDSEDDESEPEAEDEDAEDEPPPSSRPMPGSKYNARASLSATASLAKIAGVPEGSSMPKIKTALVRKAAVFNHAARLTGAKSHDGIIGQLTAMAEDAAESGKLRADLKAAKRRENYRNRMALLERLASANIPGYTRGELFVDDVDPKTGKRTKRPSRQYAEMKIGTLEGLVSAKLKNSGGGNRRSPFEPDASMLSNGGAGATEQDKQIAARTGVDPAQVATSRAALFGGAQ